MIKDKKEELERELFEAIISNKLYIVEALINGGVDINCVRNYSYPNETCYRAPLHCAISYQRYYIFKLLIDKGANVNIDYISGDTLLHFAVLAKSYKMVKYLLSKGANVNKRNDDGKLALDIALDITRELECKYIVDLLEKAHKKIDDITKERLEGSLFQVIRDNNIKSVKTYLSNGVDINCMRNYNYPDEYYYRTPLHCAISYQHYDIFKFLIDEGADINASNSCGDTPLHLAVYGSDSTMIKYLLSKDANINKLNNEGKSALDMAIKYDDRFIIDLLKKANSDNNKNEFIFNKYMPTPFSYTGINDKNEFVFNISRPAPFYYGGINIKKPSAKNPIMYYDIPNNNWVITIDSKDLNFHATGIEYEDKISVVITKESKC